MAVDFSKFDNQIDKEALKKEYENTSEVNYDPVPRGDYIVSIDKMDVRETKSGDKLMFTMQCRIVQDLQDGHQENRVIFFNRVILGNKKTEKWGDSQAIRSVNTILRKFESGIEPEFHQDYTDYGNLVEEIFDEVAGAIELEVKYDPKEFNSISIVEVYDK
jgi:hypothetical protein